MSLCINNGPELRIINLGKTGRSYSDMYMGAKTKTKTVEMESQGTLQPSSKLGWDTAYIIYCAQGTR